MLIVSVISENYTKKEGVTFNERLTEIITNLETENLKQKDQVLNRIIEFKKQLKL